MAAVKHARGVKLLLKVGDGMSPEQFTALCSINASRSITGDAATNEFNIPDCADPDALAAVVREKVSTSYSVAGAGILNTPTSKPSTTGCSQRPRRTARSSSTSPRPTAG
jgi:hypothetical protein